MTRPAHRPHPLAGAAAAFLMAAVPASAGWNIVKVTDTSGPENTYPVSPAVNAAGEVAYGAILDATFDRTVVRWKDGTATTIADTLGPWRELGEPSISAGGSVVCSFTADDENTTLSPPFFSQGILRQTSPGTPVVTIDATTRSSDPLFTNIETFTHVGGSPPSSAGPTGAPLTAYHCRIASLDGSNKRRRLYVNAAGIRTLVVEDATAPGFRTSTADWQFGGVNAAGQVAFMALRSGVTGKVGIYRAAPGVAPQLAAERDSTFTAGSTSGLLTSPTLYRIRDDGRIVMGGSINFSNTGLFLVAPGEAPQRIYSGFPIQVAVSPSGRMAYKDGGALLVGTHRVVGPGDALFGSTVTDLQMQINAVSDAGHLAFRFTLQNGLRGIALAIPAVPPLNTAEAGTPAAPAMRLWWQADPTVQLMASPDLGSWSPVTSGITISGGTAEIEVPRGVRGFFRLEMP